MAAIKKLEQRDIKIEDEETGYKKTTTIKKVRYPNGMVDSLFVDNDKSSVQVFAITKDKKVICVKQFRPNFEKEELELPGGGIEKRADKNPANASERELVEETGYEGEKPVHLFSVPYSPYSTGIRHSYMITNCVKTTKQDLDPNEYLNVVLIDLKEFVELAKKAKVRGFDAAMIGLLHLGLLSS